MKKIIIVCALLVWAAISFAQQTNPQEELTKDYYLQKSKKQKTGAWIFLGLGTGSIVAGSIIGSDKTSSGGGLFYDNAGPSALLILGGALFAAGSIPMFISAGKNKHKAMDMSFRFQHIPQLQNTAKINQPIPSINLKIRL